MTTKDIIYQLEALKDHCADWVDEEEPDNVWANDVAALTAAIQAVTALEEIDQALHGHCEACKHAEKRAYEQPCIGCINCGPFDNHHSPDYWEFRWQLGEDTTT